MNTIRATRNDAARLTSIAHAAKRHWGYAEHWIAQWRPALTLTPAYIEEHPTIIAVEEEEPVGFCSVALRTGEALLDHLWVMPAAMGRGIGRSLFAAAVDLARAAGATRLKIVGDPHAEAFYLRMGAERIGCEPAPMDGVNRFLPVLEKPLR